VDQLDGSFPQRLKPRFQDSFFGTPESVPFQSPFELGYPTLRVLLTESGPIEETGGDLLLSVVFALYAGALCARGLETMAFPARLEGNFSLVPSGCCRENRLLEFQFISYPIGSVQMRSFGTEVPTRCRIHPIHCINLRCALRLPLAATAPRPLCERWSLWCRGGASWFCRSKADCCCCAFCIA
jgi:hypothetical protein